jgi:hypothetical protein
MTAGKFLDIESKSKIRTGMGASASIFGALSCPHFSLSETGAAIRAGDYELSPAIFHVEVRPWM